MAADPEVLKGTLHGKGLRMTPQRQLVLNAITALGHCTPEQICQKVQETATTVNITTIYRTLDLLEELGLVRHTHLGHGAPTYSTAQHKHVHLVCHACGRTEEVEGELFTDLCGTLQRMHGFALDVSHLALSGKCSDCQHKE